MRESLMYGSVRGTRGNSRPYRDRRDLIALSPSPQTPSWLPACPQWGRYSRSRALYRSRRFGPRCSRFPFRPWRNAVTRCVASASDALRRNPITGIAGFCARAASGHAAAVPPSSAMNSRRLMCSP
jgi:hypothetical protein